MSWTRYSGESALAKKLLIAVLLLLLCLLLLSVGHSGLHAYSGKDEYHLSIRTVLSMHEQDRWLVPFLDGEPRLRKPPGLYWMGRVALESCGLSLYCIRLPAMIWASVWAIALVGLARWLYPVAKTRSALFVAAALLSAVGFLVEGRRLMLDLPMTAASSLALYGTWKLLAAHAPQGQERIVVPGLVSGLFWTVFSALAMSIALLLKGPAGLLVWVSGLLFVNFAFPQLKHKRLGVLICHAFVVLAASVAATLPWFLSVVDYQDAVLTVASEEIEARQLGSFSLIPVLGLWVIASPWLLVVLHGMWQSHFANQHALEQSDQRRVVLGLAIWLLLTLLPFFFMRTFERYLLGSLVPLFLAIPLCLLRRPQIFASVPSWLRLASALPMIAVIVLVQCFAIWFELQPLAYAVLPLVLIAIFSVIWWSARSFVSVASAVGLWILNVQVFISLSYPSLQINHAPAWLVKHAMQESLVYFGGPHPAMLSAVTGKAHRHVNPSAFDPLRSVQSGTWIVSLQSDAELLKVLAGQAGLQAKEIGRWTALINQGSALRFTRPGASWELALRTRQLQELKSELTVFELIQSGL